jgi:hypothetical protein
LRDLAPVGTVSASTIVLVTDPKLGFRSVQELVSAAKANPGKLTFGSVGAGGSLHLGGEMLKLMSGIDIVHVPYKGAAQVLTDIMGGHVSMMFVSMASVLPLASSGKIRPLAVASLKRAGALPDVPTLDSIYPGFEVTANNGVVAPAKTPPAIINRLNQAMAKSLSDPWVRERFARSGVEPVISTPEEFAALPEPQRAIVRELRSIGRPLDTSGINTALNTTVAEIGNIRTEMERDPAPRPTSSGYAEWQRRDADRRERLRVAEERRRTYEDDLRFGRQPSGQTGAGGQTRNWDPATNSLR